MTSARLCSSLPFLPIPFPSLPSPSPRTSSCALAPSNSSSLFTHEPLRRRKQRFHRAAGADLLGDFGARDPFPAEIESNFGEKVLGNVDTEHRILIPNLSALSLAQQECSPISPSQPPMTIDEAQSLLRKASTEDPIVVEFISRILMLQHVSIVKRKSCIEATVLTNLIYVGNVEMEEGRTEFLIKWPIAKLKMSAADGGKASRGLSMNDFIVAAKIDKVKISDLIPKKRVWA
ncbi:hypothetical protein ACLOJK_030396 [Asimina triloba]